MIWIIIANSNQCRFYAFDKKQAEATLIKEISHPENKAKKGDYLTSDRPGHFATDASAHGAFSPHTDPKDIAVDDYAREIAHDLNRGRNAQAYKNLVIITPAHMSGLLNKHLDKHVKELVSLEIHKDVMQLSHSELVEYLRELKMNHA